MSYASAEFCDLPMGVPLKLLDVVGVVEMTYVVVVMKVDVVVVVEALVVGSRVNFVVIARLDGMEERRGRCGQRTDEEDAMVNGEGSGYGWVANDGEMWQRQRREVGLNGEYTTQPRGKR
eukprot:Gb_12532 [translate_table: standard]